jgi:Holliday junction resolvasome RuvABC endonuclease subunit
MKILAIDPALSNIGFARLIVPDDITSKEIILDGIRLVHTKKQSGKTVRKNSDDLRRASEGWEAMEEEAEWADIVAAEIPSGTQSARGAMSNGISLGLLAALGFKRPLIEVTAAEAKKIVTGRSTGSKSEMIQWAVAKFPDANWQRKRFKGEMRLLDSNEHMADAIAIGLAALRTPEFKAAVAMKRSSMTSRI